MKLNEEFDRLKTEARQQTFTYIAGGFGLVAGLAWNDAIRSAIEYWFPASSDSILIKFIYAVGITLVVVIILTYLKTLLTDKPKT